MDPMGVQTSTKTTSAALGIQLLEFRERRKTTLFLFIKLMLAKLCTKTKIDPKVYFLVSYGVAKEQIIRGEPNIHSVGRASSLGGGRNTAWISKSRPPQPN